MHPWAEAVRPAHWKKTLKVFDRVFRIALDHKCDIIFLGDLFESKRSIRSDVMAATYERIARLMQRDKRCQFHFIAGNHDLYAGTCTQTAFKLGKRFHLHTGDRSSVIDMDYGVVALPYGAQAPYDMNYAVLCSHVDLRGAQMGTGILAESSSVDEQLFLKTMDRALVLNGHYHVPQVIDWGKKYVKIQCAGAPLQHNWNDARYSHVRRGIWLLTVYAPADKCPPLLAHIPLKEFPRFYVDPPPNRRIREGIDFVQRSISEKDVGVLRTGDEVISGRDPAAFIPEYTKSMIKDVGKQKKLIRAGLALMKGET